MRPRAPKILLRLAFKNVIVGVQRAAEFRRDRQMGIETRMTGDEQDSTIAGAGVNRPFAVDYEPTPWRDLEALLGRLDIAPARFTFVDLGAGKGRTLFAAAALPFRRIVGVEFSPQLHRICLSNIRSFRSRRQRCFRLEAVCADAAEYEYPDDNLVVFLFNPFGHPPLERAVERLRDHHARHGKKIVVVYHNAKYGDILQRAPFLRQIAMPPPLLYPLFRPWRPTAIFESV